MNPTVSAPQNKARITLKLLLERSASEANLIEKPRARRYPLTATVEIVDMETGAELHAQTTDISAFGCRVNTSRWVAGTKVRVRIFHRGAVLSALGIIANLQTKGAMGVSFTQIDDKQQSVLEKWLTELRDTREKAPSRR